jgi:Flp pilus assembly protein TadD
MAGARDSALAAFGRAIDQMRAREEERTVVLYDSKALLEQSRGLIYEQMERDSLAREAYGRALQEDLSYHPAHARLAMLALSHGDTATALSELELAVQLKGDDAALRHAYAYVLGISGRVGDAAPHLQKAIELEPWYAAPYELLGRMYQSSEMLPEARRYYEGFLARASRHDPMVASVQQRLAQLPADASAPPAQKP